VRLNRKRKLQEEKMKRLLLTLSLVIAMSGSAFAATTIMDWGRY